MNLIISLPLLIMAICFVIRIPIGLSMIIASISYFLATGQDVGIVSDTIMSSFYASNVLVAIPLFIFTANVMSSGKVTEYMFTFVKSLIGPKRGAMAYINIIVSLIFSGMTGSATADAAGIGVMEISEMKKDGYDDEFSAALTAATATVGPIFPPSIPLVIYAMLAQVSVGRLFLAGMIPAILICIALGFYVFYISRKRDYPRGIEFSLKEFGKYTLRAFPALMTPVILLGGIYSGIVTASEAGALAAIYTIAISILAYRVLSLKSFYNVILDTIIQTGKIFAIVAGAYVMAYIVTSSGMSQTISKWFLGITSNKYLFLFLINVVFLILGMFFDTNVLLLVFIPLIIPIVKVLGIDLVHFGVIITVNMMIGLSTPPYGMLCYISGSIADVPIQNVFREILPMIGIMIGILLLITYVPWLVLLN